jgi:hypothetical protein
MTRVWVIGNANACTIKARAGDVNAPDAQSNQPSFDKLAACLDCQRAAPCRSEPPSLPGLPVGRL